MYTLDDDGRSYNRRPCISNKMITHVRVLSSDGPLTTQPSLNYRQKLASELNRGEQYNYPCNTHETQLNNSKKLLLTSCDLHIPPKVLSP